MPITQQFGSIQDPQHTRLLRGDHERQPRDKYPVRAEDKDHVVRRHDVVVSDESSNGLHEHSIPEGNAGFFITMFTERAKITYEEAFSFINRLGWPLPLPLLFLKLGSGRWGGGFNTREIEVDRCTKMKQQRQQLV